jgi:tRNA dimethylallyltransferase
VSADSRQVYRGMDIGTAKVSRAGRERVPHHGLDLVDPDEPFNVAEFQRHAFDALRGIATGGRLALLVGGTGLYIRAVARGFRLGDAPPDPDLRRDLEQMLTDRGAPALARELARVAPELAADTDLANPRRVIRALERVRSGARVAREPAGYPAPVLWLGLRLEPSEHRERIAARAAAQFAGGLLEEARALEARYDRRLPAFSAFGYREAMALNAGEFDRATALERTVTRTWAYARRQRTWFRAERDIEWLDAGDALEAATARASRFVEESRTARR